MSISIKTSWINKAVIFLMIINSGGIFIVKNFYITALTLFLIILKLLISNRKIFNYTLISILFVSLLLIINFFIADEYQNPSPYIIYFLYFLIAILFLDSYNKKYECLRNDIYLVIKIFLFHAVFSFIMQFIVKDSLIIYMDGIARTYNMIVFYPYIDYGNLLLRNQGLFWEPGILQLYMNLLFFMSMSIYKNKTISLLSFLMIFSTQSTMGLIIIFLQIIYFYLKSNISIKRHFLFLPVFVFLMFAVWNIVNVNLNEKLYGKAASSSYARMYDTITAINIIEEFPLSGIGLNIEKYYQMQQKHGYLNTDLTRDEITERGNTNGVLKLGVEFGLIFAFILLFSLYSQKIYDKHSLFFFIILMLSLMTEPILKSPFILLFVVTGLQSFLSQRKSNYV